MKKKIFGIYVMTLLILGTSLQVAGMDNNEENINKFNIIPESTEKGWFYLESFPNYSPMGMPDFSQKQHYWRYIVDGGNGISESIAVGDDVQITPFGDPVVDPAGTIIAMGPNCCLESTPGGDDVEFWNFCFLTSLANCFWWLDSKYEDPDGTPGDGEDQFPLVKDYGSGDDHDTDNAPLLICKLANWMGVASYNFTFPSTEIAIAEWFNLSGLGNVFDSVIYPYANFSFMASEIEQGKPVIMKVIFFNNVSGELIFQGNHYVSCAGVNSDEQKIAICDPFLDIDNPGSYDHNDAINVSYDIYDVEMGSPCPEQPYINFWLPNYWPYYDYSLVEGFGSINTLNNPPNEPSISGEIEGKAGQEYEYTFSTTDPNDDDVYYNIEWGDGNTENWFGPYNSGEEVVVSHSWDEQDTYTIRARAKDTDNLWGPWGELEVTMPVNQQYQYPMFHWFLERFPNAFPILRHLIEVQC